MKKKLLKALSAISFVSALYASIIVADANMRYISFEACAALEVILMIIMYVSAYIGGAFDTPEED